MVLTCYPVLNGQSVSDQELARLLANASSRQAAVATITASGNAKLPLLLSWIRKTPSQVDENELYIGMADAFGELKSREAIPFLIKNISLSRYLTATNWLKTASVLEDQLPAVRALIKIGPHASRALMRANTEPMFAEDRLYSIFAISQIEGVPEARDFLSSASGLANVERYWASEALNRLEKGRPPE
jgi:hypothetical protein